jgi:predicted nucleic acid-binding protein
VWSGSGAFQAGNAPYSAYRIAMSVPPLAIYGEQVGKALRGGMTIGKDDGQSGAIALAHGGTTVATREYAPFEGLFDPGVEGGRD